MAKHSKRSSILKANAARRISELLCVRRDRARNRRLEFGVILPPFAARPEFKVKVIILRSLVYSIFSVLSPTLAVFFFFGF